TKPKNPDCSSYNPATGRWDTCEWRYDPTVGKYVENFVPTKEDPASGSQVPASASGTSGLPQSSTPDGAFDLFYNADISNVVVSQAASGDALVSFNTTGGSALSGDALVLATLLNIVQSSTSFNGGQIATFSSNIYGDIYGDLFIDPSLTSGLQPSAAPDNSDVSLNVEGSSSIYNDITLDAQSGNAAVTNNTTAGDATSGNATAMLNLVNILNSAISSSSSFIGVLNIFGSLNGDILLPIDMLNTLIASNNHSGDLSADLSDNQSIENIVETAAKSGDATVTHNTSAGAAATGDASTNITLLNLTGRQVVASNSLLVFVNVLGEWVGVIMDAPAGSTSAMFGTGVTQNDCSSCSGGDTEINANTESKISNNVLVNAQSGDATVASNTTGGSATSGDANTFANILNISNSTFSFTDWFRLIFINIT
ncbi:MAG: hypothetical protein ACRD4B_03570, partial [Acidobacteriota bacterium]